jgi:hypothetical protein
MFWGEIDPSRPLAHIKLPIEYAGKWIVRFWWAMRCAAGAGGAKNSPE